MTPLRKFIFSALLTTTALTATLPAQAMPDQPAACGEMSSPQGHGRHGNHAAGLPGEPLPPYLHGLKLSESQRDRIFDLMHDQAPQLRAIGKKVRQSVEQLHRQALSPAYDSAQTRNLADSAGRAHGEMLARRAEIDQKIFAILNAEQRQQLAAKIADQP